MGMDMDMDALAEAKPFDKAFIDAMIPHHEGAIAMAKKLLAGGATPQLRTLAENVIRTQTAEIAQMREWRAEWFGSAAAGAAPDESGTGSSHMGH